MIRQLVLLTVFTTQTAFAVKLPNSCKEIRHNYGRVQEDIRFQKSLVNDSNKDRNKLFAISAAAASAFAGLVGGLAVGGAAAGSSGAFLSIAKAAGSLSALAVATGTISGYALGDSAKALNSMLSYLQVPYADILSEREEILEDMRTSKFSNTKYFFGTIENVVSSNNRLKRLLKNYEIERDILEALITQCEITEEDTLSIPHLNRSRYLNIGNRYREATGHIRNNNAHILTLKKMYTQ